jgi:glycosyltransferase involved in cell wall biosynthesis
VLIDCDLPMAQEIGKVVDHVICTSKVLQGRYLEKDVKASFIEDSPELYFNSRIKKKNETLKCFWFGYNTSQKWNEVLWLEHLFKDDRLSKWELVTISNHPNANIQWTPDFLEALKSADVIALPVISDDEESSVKSANRLLQSMALSLPVICSSLPSYTDIITQGKDAIICLSHDEWIEAFQKLEEEKIREQIGKSAYLTSVKFSIDKTSLEWIRELRLSEEFKNDNLQILEETQTRLGNFFYRLLLKKNLFYWRKMSFSFSNVGLLFNCILLKAKKRL